MYIIKTISNVSKSVYVPTGLPGPPRKQNNENNKKAKWVKKPL